MGTLQQIFQQAVSIEPTCEKSAVILYVLLIIVGSSVLKVDDIHVLTLGEAESLVVRVEALITFTPTPSRSIRGHAGAIGNEIRTRVIRWSTVITYCSKRLPCKRKFKFSFSLIQLDHSWGKSYS